MSMIPAPVTSIASTQACTRRAPDPEPAARSQREPMAELLEVLELHLGPPEPAPSTDDVATMASTPGAQPQAIRPAIPTGGDPGGTLGDLESTCGRAPDPGFFAR